MRAFLGRLRRDRRGSIAVLGGVGLMVVVAVATLAADMARLSLAQGRLQSAVDAATLAAARSLSDGEAAAGAAVGAVFAANLGDGLSGVAVDEPAVAFQRDDAGLPSRVRVSVTARVSLMMGGLGGLLGDAAPQSAIVASAATATRRIRGAEIALVLDNTGSMAGARINDLQNATRTLIEALFGENQSVPGLSVAVVPYSATVNIGAQHVGWLRPADRIALDGAFHPTAWKGCVRARSLAALESDAPPAASGDIPAFNWPTSMICKANGANCTYPGGQTLHDRSPNYWPRPTGRAVDDRLSSGNNGYGPNLGCGAPILPLTRLRSDLDAIVPLLQAWHRGGTLGNVGLSWGWRALSPRWRGLWRRAGGSEVAGAPLDYDDPSSRKFIVMMTDGANGFHNSDDTSLGRTGETLSNTGQIDASMLRLCTAIKAAGVTIYTVTFGTGISNATRATYSACAADPSGNGRYFDAPTGGVLRDVFGAIAGTITDLRLVE
jgi:Flp pilus assembly protein TadG